MQAVRLGRLLQTMLPIQPRLCPLPQLEASRWPCPDSRRRRLLVQSPLVPIARAVSGQVALPGRVRSLPAGPSQQVLAGGVSSPPSLRAEPPQQALACGVPAPP